MKGRPVRLTRRGLIALIGSMFIASLFGGAATADVCWWGKCGPADNPAPALTPQIGTPYGPVVCPTAGGC